MTYCENALKHGSGKGIIGNLYLLWKSKGNETKMAYYKTELDKLKLFQLKVLS